MELASPGRLLMLMAGRTLLWVTAHRLRVASHGQLRLASPNLVLNGPCLLHG
jgi:hypothetical protein